jgi:hypothetical protein
VEVSYRWLLEIGDTEAKLKLEGGSDVSVDAFRYGLVDEK